MAKVIGRMIGSIIGLAIDAAALSILWTDLGLRHVFGAPSLGWVNWFLLGFVLSVLVSVVAGSWLNSIEARAQAEAWETKRRGRR